MSQDDIEPTFVNWYTLLQMKTWKHKAAAFDHLEIMWKGEPGMKAWVAISCGDKSRALVDVVEEVWHSFSARTGYCNCGKCRKRLE